MEVLSLAATVFTAVAGIFISYLLQRPYVRVVKMFDPAGGVDMAHYKLKNAGAATAICIVLADRNGHVIDLDLQLAQSFGYVDALAPGAEIRIGVSGDARPTHVFYENLFGLLYQTALTDAGQRFRMTSRIVWRKSQIPAPVLSELPHHWYR